MTSIPVIVLNNISSYIMHKSIEFDVSVHLNFSFIYRKICHTYILALLVVNHFEILIDFSTSRNTNCLIKIE